MRRRGRAQAGAVGLLLAATLVGGAAAAFAQADAERLRSAKALFFDRRYAEAREAWQQVQAGGRGTEAEAAAYWIARCSENLAELDRALEEYGAYLAGRPSDRTLAEEARTSRVGLAARLYKAGDRRHLPLLREALGDPSKTVRYFAALQLSTLGRDVGRAAVPVLKKILAEERDEDLVERAKLALLRLEPGALVERPVAPAAPPRAAAPAVPPRTSPREASWIRVRIYQKAAAKPQVSVNLPVALAELVFKSLPDEAKTELRKKGYDAENFWDRLKKLGPTEIITIEGDDGERVQIWIE